MAREALAASNYALDIATGGGERLATFAPFRGRVVASEGWTPNLSIAAETLKSCAVPVVNASSERLPFASGTFDLVLNRHGGITPAEIVRVLRREGRFLTQQVDPEDWPELRRYFPDVTDTSANELGRRLEEFRTLGAVVAGQRHAYRVAYGGIEDLVFNLAVAPWTIPGLSFERDVTKLISLATDLTTPNGLELTRALYLLDARWT